MYGITNAHNLAGFYSSDLTSWVLCARYERFNVHLRPYGPTGDFAPMDKYGKWGEVLNLAIPKLYNTRILDTSGLNIPLIGYYAWRNPRFKIFIWTDPGYGASFQPSGYRTPTRFSEDDHNLYISSIYFSTTHDGTPVQFNDQWLSFRILVFQELPNPSILPNYGLVMQKPNGHVTFNSHYMPLIIRSIAPVPHVYHRMDMLGYMRTNKALGLDNSRRPACEYVNIGRAETGILSCDVVATYRASQNGLVPTSVRVEKDLNRYAGLLDWRKLIRWGDQSYFCPYEGYEFEWGIPVIYTNDYF